MTQYQDQIGAWHAGSILVAAVLRRTEFGAIAATQMMFLLALDEHEFALLYPDEMAGESVARRGKSELLISGQFHFYEVYRNRELGIGKICRRT